jgi:hypothetical protein
MSCPRGCGREAGELHACIWDEDGDECRCCETCTARCQASFDWIANSAPSVVLTTGGIEVSYSAGDVAN